MEDRNSRIVLKNLLTAAKTGSGIVVYFNLPNAHDSIWQLAAAYNCYMDGLHRQTLL